MFHLSTLMNCIWPMLLLFLFSLFSVKKKSNPLKKALATASRLANQGHVVLHQKQRLAEISAMSIAAVDLAVAATSLANFLMDSCVKVQLVWTKNNKVSHLARGGGWLDSTHKPTTANYYCRNSGCINYLCKSSESGLFRCRPCLVPPDPPSAEGLSALETWHDCWLQARFVPPCWTQRLVIIQIVLVHKWKACWGCGHVESW